MKKVFFFFLWFVLNLLQLFSQDFNDIVIGTPGGRPSGNLIQTTSLNTTTIKEVVIIAMDPGSSCLLPDWYDDLFGTFLPQYFDESTHSNFIYEPSVLKRDATHAYEMLTVPPQHDHGDANMLHVLQEADISVDFADYDWNHDGIVELHFTSIGPGNWGVAYVGGGYSCEYTTNDLEDGSYIKVRVTHESRGINRDNYYGVIVHEDGHYYFNFDDQDHEGLSLFSHWGLGSFDAMSNALGFYDEDHNYLQPSPYNPVYSKVNNWITATPINSNSLDYALQDYQTHNALYEYAPSTFPTNAVTDEKFYISYIQPNRSYVFQNYPITDREKGGLLIWHKKGDGLLSFGDFTYWNRKDIDIECAHGKTMWTDDQYDTGIQDPISGRDRLEVRKIKNNHLVGGPYYGQCEVGDASILYIPDDGKSFTFYSNPNSNWYNQIENYAHNIPSGFSIKNIRTESGIVKVDIRFNDYSITENATLYAGNWYFNNSVTVASNVTLTIKPGANIIFTNGASLTINGIVNAAGISTNKITFNFNSPNSTTQNGIKFNSGSSGTINYAIVKNGYYGVSVAGNPTGTINITNSTISNSSYAIYVNGNTSSNVNITGCDIGTSSGGINLNSALANIDGCTIHNITTYGGGAVVFNNSGGTIKNCNIQNNSIATNGISILNNSSPYVFQNTIANNTLNGVYVLQASPSLQSNIISTTGYGHAAVSNNSYSHTLFGKTSYPFDGYNTISGSYYGIYVGDHSLIQAGYSDIARYNRILGNTYNTYVTGTSTLYAKNDWWGNPLDITKFHTDAGSYFYYLPPLPDDPSGSQSSVARNLPAVSNAVSVNTAYTPEEELLLKAKELQEKDQLSEAIDIYKELIKTNSEKSIGEIALLELNNIYCNTNDKNIKDYFKEFKLSKNNKKRLYPIALEILSLNNKREKNFTESLDDCETLIKEFSSTEHEKNALMNKFFLYYDNNDFPSAKTVIEKLANSFTDSPEVGAAISLLNIQDIENEKILPKAQALNNIMTENLPESYEINNYPNPFNPVTTIAYQIPKDGLVMIKVFDILGKEVKTLVNEYKEIGKYTVQFDASSLTSGTYIYQLRVNDYTSNKKMLLLK